jgi:hypothetical protein
MLVISPTPQLQNPYSQSLEHAQTTQTVSWAKNGDEDLEKPLRHSNLGKSKKNAFENFSKRSASDVRSTAY